MDHNDDVSTRIAHLEAEILIHERRADEHLDVARLLRKNIRSLKDSVATTRINTSVNYNLESFQWSTALRDKRSSVFNIPSFRLCQLSACNANMDGRDIICIMPTGGGKSLTYQLPAILSPGCTLVISPLIALIHDQLIYLHSSSIPAVTLTTSTPSPEKKDILARLSRLALNSLSPSEHEIKLCYLAPERLEKDSSFLSVLQLLVDNNKIARFVIDEAHCVSEMGHDFRKAYVALSMLRQKFPKVPIMALSATCPKRVVDDIIHILGLSPITPKGKGTVYLSSPLYRKNLHYAVLPKPKGTPALLLAMTQFILGRHAEDSGIVYCFTQKETESVAKELGRLSKGKILTGSYHSDMPSRQKEALHHAWRAGRIKVVCATIAFGMGIDKGDVRFVIHYTIPKSLEGYYQESGRAGRDGKDADCVLYYRPQDASTMSVVTSYDKDGRSKLHSMLEFAQDLEGCRKIHFAHYFSNNNNEKDEGAMQRCGHCDNCTRGPGTVEVRDVTLEAWQLLKIVEEVGRNKGLLTIAMLSEMVRGENKKKNKKKEREEMDLERISGGPVDLAKEDVEHLVVRLLVLQYLKEEFRHNQYSTVMYVAAGRLAPRLTYLAREEVRGNGAVKVECAFRIDGKKKKKKEVQERKGKRKRVDSDSDDSSDDEVEVYEWSHTFRQEPVVVRQRVASGSSSWKGKTVLEGDNEVLVLSD